MPLGVIERDLPERPIDLAIKSSPIGLGLLEGLDRRRAQRQRPDAARRAGDRHEPGSALRGHVDLNDAAFLVTSTGARYKNGHATLRLARDRVGIDALHLEDNGGHPLDVHGSLATHELSVGDLSIDGTARHFEVLRNEFGQIDVDASLQLRGKFESPRVTGDITINGGDLKVDVILDTLLFRPYATEPIAVAEIDAVAALNPWERLGLDVTLHVPDSLKLTGENIQVSPGTPIGLGNINLRVGGDLSLYKDPGQPLSVTGSFDSISGRYNFQGRPFDIDPASSINFHGDLNPEVYVTVTRVIYGRGNPRHDRRPAHEPRAAPREQSPARAVRHPVADRVQCADERLCRRRSRPTWRCAPERWPPGSWPRRSSPRFSERSVSTRSRSSRAATWATDRS